MNSFETNNFSGKKVIVRVDFNVPLDKNFNIVDDTRIKSSLPTIKKLISDGAKIILISHLGRPSGKEKGLSLSHLVSPLCSILGLPVLFSNDCIGKTTLKQVSNLKNGEIILLENLRFYKEEVTGNIDFAKQLSQLGDVYVNDAFGTSHRKHASTAIIAQFFKNNRHLGFLFYNEIKALEKSLVSPKRPFTAIIGGSKISGKIDLIESLLNTVDNLIIGGGMSYTFVKALGGNVGSSLVEDEKISVAKQIIISSKEKNINLLLPIDSVNSKSLDNNNEVFSSNINSIPKELMGLDIGEKTTSLFAKTISSSKTIIWNGPMGVYEVSNFRSGTKKIADSICKATEKGAFSLVGGGDSIAAIKMFNLKSRFSYISTGGGAMLEYLKGGVLPGLKSIVK